MLSVLVLVGAVGPLAQMEAAIRGHRSLECDVVTTVYGKRGRGRFRVLAPNCAWMETEGIVLATDGREAWNAMTGSKLWQKCAVSQVLEPSRTMPGFGLLLGGAPTVAKGPSRVERVGNEKMVVVPIVTPKGAPPSMTFTLYLSPRTWLPSGLQMTRLIPGTTRRGEILYRFSNVRLDTPLRPPDFRFRPLRNFQEMKPMPKGDGMPPAARRAMEGKGG